MNLIRNRYKIKPATDEDVPDLTHMLFSLRKHMFKNNSLLWKYSKKRTAEQPRFYKKMIRNPDIYLIVLYDTISSYIVGIGFGWIIENDQYEQKKFGQIFFFATLKFEDC